MSAAGANPERKVYVRLSADCEGWAQAQRLGIKSGALIPARAVPAPGALADGFWVGQDRGSTPGVTAVPGLLQVTVEGEPDYYQFESGAVSQFGRMMISDNERFNNAVVSQGGNTTFSLIEYSIVTDVPAPQSSGVLETAAAAPGSTLLQAPHFGGGLASAAAAPAGGIGGGGVRAGVFSALKLPLNGLRPGTGLVSNPGPSINKPRHGVAAAQAQPAANGVGHPAQSVNPGRAALEARARIGAAAAGGLQPRAPTSAAARATGGAAAGGPQKFTLVLCAAAPLVAAYAGKSAKAIKAPMQKCGGEGCFVTVDSDTPLLSHLLNERLDNEDIGAVMDTAAEKGTPYIREIAAELYKAKHDAALKKGNKPAILEKLPVPESFALYDPTTCARLPDGATAAEVQRIVAVSKTKTAIVLASLRPDVVALLKQAEAFMEDGYEAAAGGRNRPLRPPLGLHDDDDTAAEAPSAAAPLSSLPAVPNGMLAGGAPTAAPGVDMAGPRAAAGEVNGAARADVSWGSPPAGAEGGAAAAGGRAPAAAAAESPRASSSPAAAAGARAPSKAARRAAPELAEAPLNDAAPDGATVAAVGETPIGVRHARMRSTQRRLGLEATINPDWAILPLPNPVVQRKIECMAASVERKEVGFIPLAARFAVGFEALEVMSLSRYRSGKRPPPPELVAALIAVRVAAPLIIDMFEEQEKHNKNAKARLDAVQAAAEADEAAAAAALAEAAQAKEEAPEKEAQAAPALAAAKFAWIQAHEAHEAAQDDTVAAMYHLEHFEDEAKAAPPPGASGEAAATARATQAAEVERARAVWLEMCAAQDITEARLAEAKEAYDVMLAAAQRAVDSEPAPPPPAATTSSDTGAESADSEDDGSSGDSTRPAPAQPPERVSERQAKRKAETQAAE